MSAPQVYIVYPALFVPVTLIFIAAVAAYFWTWWFLSAIPFIYLGSVAAAPNMNMVQGCLVYVSGLVGLALCPFHQLLGLSILIGIISSYGLSVIEKVVRMKPYVNADPEE